MSEETVKVVYNCWYGGFGMSEKAVHRYAELKGFKVYPEDGTLWLKNYYLTPPEERSDTPTLSGEEFNIQGIPRHDPVLIQVVEELGSEASARSASLAIREIPKGSRYWIDEYDGNERVKLDTEFDWVQV